MLHIFLEVLGKLNEVTDSTSLSPKLEFYSNYNLEDLCMPINIEELHNLLVESQYSSHETKFIIDSFSKGFDIGYRGVET